MFLFCVQVIPILFEPFDEVAFVVVAFVVAFVVVAFVVVAFVVVAFVVALFLIFFVYFPSLSAFYSEFGVLLRMCVQL